MYKIPRYINKPLTFIGLEMDEVALIYFAAFYGYMVQSPVHFILLLAGAIWFILSKKRHPQGFFRHALYFISLYKLDNYPNYSKQEFLE
jgi:type IV conjugative transfer system protein TraL